ncbi:MAG: hypothetical protein ICV73_12510 [Acetobacteraceae bacterium]|nr:hypothetical protein [Acetobacteraceae bacterium]
MDIALRRLARPPQPATRDGRPAAAVRRRRFLLLAPLAAASCARREEPPPPALAPLSWTHLTPLPLDVAALEVVPSSPPPAPGDIGALLPTPPAEAVRGMARDRLSAAGASGQAVFLVTAANVVQEGGGRRGALRCVLGCRLEVTGKGGGEDGGGPGFAEARVEHEVSGPDAARPRAAEILLRRAMDDLNVEFEFQLRRNLRRWVAAAAPPGAAVPPAVGREELAPSGGAASGGQPGGGGAPKASEAGPLPPSEGEE